MGLRINGIGREYPLPTLIKIYYKYASFPPHLKLNVTSVDTGTSVEKDYDIKSILEAAWKIVESRAKGKPCNNYFKTLSRGRSLGDVLGEGDITLHMLVPKKDEYGFDKVPLANTAGRDIGINPVLFTEKDSAELACTLIHELAHVAGATTNADAQDAHAAEKSLVHCGCSKQYDETIVGSIELSNVGRRMA
jgi:hypothetical protein